MGELMEKHQGRKEVTDHGTDQLVKKLEKLENVSVGDVVIQLKHPVVENLSNDIARGMVRARLMEYDDGVLIRPLQVMEKLPNNQIRVQIIRHDLAGIAMPGGRKMISTGGTSIIEEKDLYSLDAVERVLDKANLVGRYFSETGGFKPDDDVDPYKPPGGGRDPDQDEKIVEK